ncbi:MAG: hypothetical protein ACREM3_13190 [Candidatus Rokuibacteriota bacterium]
MKRLLTAVGVLTLGAGVLTGCTESGSDRVGERPVERTPSASPPTTTTPPSATSPARPPDATTSPSTSPSRPPAGAPSGGGTK